MSESSPALSSTDSQTPFVDEETPFKMKWGLLKKIIWTSVAITAAAVGWAVNIKGDLSKQAERSERIEIRVQSIEDSVKQQTEAIYEQRTNMRLMDQKLDTIARQTR